MKDAKAPPEYKKPLPDLDDPATRPYWNSTKAHKLEMPICQSCKYVIWPPAVVCPECLSPEVRYGAVATGGTIWSYAVYHRAFHPGFQADLPYNVVLVQMDAGPVVYGNLLAPNDQLKIGARVRVAFDDVTPEVTLVKWELAPE